MRSSLFCLIAAALIIAGCSSTVKISQTESVNPPQLKSELDTIKAKRFDTGKMWTFEYPPLEYFQQEYGFTPTQGWLDSLRLGALKFATYCSASFISADGLIMTNNHCARESVSEVNLIDETIADSGFYASSLKDERKVPDLFVDQLVLIKDITSEITSSTENITDYNDRSQKEREIISNITAREEKSTGLIISVVSLFNGGRYSLYGYKRYSDVRLVFVPEGQLGFFGGDFDNFTFPRYNLDCSFFRVYDENGNPVNTKNYFRWDTLGAQDGDPVFVVGNPGTTTRLYTVAQLEYQRDYQYPQIINFYKNMINVFRGLIDESPDKKDQYQVELLKYTNSEKALTGYLNGLKDPKLMQRKRDFEKTFRETVNKDPELKAKYGDIWDKISDIRKRIGEINNKAVSSNGNPMMTPEYVFVAQELINIADEIRLPESERSESYKEDKLDSLINVLYSEDFNDEHNRSLLIDYIKELYERPGKDDPVVDNFTKGKSPEEAADYILQKSEITNLEKVKALIRKGSDAILSSDDPFIRFELQEEKRQSELQAEENNLAYEEEKYNNLLGKAIFDVYGTTIPPDATFTLRLADGVVEGFPYNGTISPPFTTFYGLYDRYYSFDKQMPWALPGKWENPPADFRLNTPFNFVSTNDIIGGSSGSPVLNKEGELVGLAFDGNMESLPGDFIYTTETNRMIGLDVRGMLEALSKIYKAARLVNEIKRGTAELNESRR